MPASVVDIFIFICFKGGITCRGKPEEGLLAAAVLSIVQWLLTCMQYAVKNMAELKNGNVEITPMLDRPATILNEILKCDFLVAMLYLAKHECRGMFY